MSIQKLKISSLGLKWYHWSILIASITLTLAAWHISHTQAVNQKRARFEQYAQKTVTLVRERMQSYEATLLGAVAALQAYGNRPDRSQWREFTRSLALQERFPGIYGIGLIHHVQDAELEAYLAWQRESHPDFQIHPFTMKQEYWPVSYVEPEHANALAIGLDMGQEEHRFAAAKKARETRQTQITAPIYLTQYEKKTPGFKLYLPWFESAQVEAGVENNASFLGLVYGTFVVENLMHGTLADIDRQVHFSIHDGNTILYDEISRSPSSSLPRARFKTTKTVPMYGRSWEFHIRTTELFNQQSNHHKPLLILLSGIAINALLLIVFIVLARSNLRATAYARKATQHLDQKRQELDAALKQLAKKNENLEEANAELSQFSYIASHDLKEPLRTLRTFASYLSKDLETQKWARVKEDLSHIDAAALRMTRLVDDLLAFSRASNSTLTTKAVASSTIFEEVCSNLRAQIEASAAVINIEVGNIYLDIDRSLIVQAVQNLVSNAIKFCSPDQQPTIQLSARVSKANRRTGILNVQDDGIGIEPQRCKEIFFAFKRLHGVSEYEGSGIGLSIVKKVVDRHGGEVSVYSEPGIGSCFTIALPLAEQSARPSSSCAVQ